MPRKHRTTLSVNYSFHQFVKDNIDFLTDTDQLKKYVMVGKYFDLFGALPNVETRKHTLNLSHDVPKLFTYPELHLALIVRCVMEWDDNKVNQFYETYIQNLPIPNQNSKPQSQPKPKKSSMRINPDRMKKEHADKKAKKEGDGKYNVPVDTMFGKTAADFLMGLKVAYRSPLLIQKLKQYLTEQPDMDEIKKLDTPNPDAPKTGVRTVPLSQNEWSRIVTTELHLSDLATNDKYQFFYWFGYDLSQSQKG